MKTINSIIIFLSVLFVMQSCSDIDSLQEDPNRTVNASPELILTNLEIEAFSKNVSRNSALASRQMAYLDGESQYQYYSWQRSGFGDYQHMKQAVIMAQEAARTGRTVYNPLSKFFKSYFAVELTQRFGDIPYTEAIKLESDGINKPKYDAQRDVYINVLDELKSAADEMATADGIIAGDVIYQGDKLKWQKLINSYRLRVLMSLSLKDGQDGLNIGQRINAIVNNPSQYPIFSSADDAGVIHYVNVQDNRYPLFNSNSLQTAYYMERTFIDRLKTLQDPRLFVMAEQTPNAVADNLAIDDFEAYGGLLGSTPFSDLAIDATDGKASRIKPRYYNDPVNEPGVLMGYAELQFILAEAAQRGWISGDAAAYYNEGVTASMNFYGINDTDAINAYLNQGSVMLTGSNAIQRIMEQKHIALFLNSGWQMFFEQRRTGYPEFIVTNEINGGKVPKRFLYPDEEINNNNENLESAIQSQFGAQESINDLMWLLK